MERVEEKASEVRGDAPASYRDEAPPRLAEGTRRETSGVCITTSCDTIDQFVAMFQRYCDGSAIFVANTQRAIGATVMFSFELRDKTAVLVGKGAVAEQFTGMQNPFGREGILLTIQKLTRDSVAVMQRMLAERKRASIEQHTPAPAEPPPRATHAKDIKIPSPAAQPAAKPRAMTVLGMPIVSKPPAESGFKIPGIPKRIEPRLAEGTPRPVVQKPPVDAVPQPVPTHDTVRDEIPFALRHQLMLHEQRAKAVPVRELRGIDFDLDGAWEEPEPAVPVVEPVVAAPVVAAPVVAAPVVAAPVIAAEAPPVELPMAEEIAVQPIDDDEIPVQGVMAEDLSFAPTPLPVIEEIPVVMPLVSPWWRTPLRWTARVALVAALFVGAAMATLFVTAPHHGASAPPAPASTSHADPSSGLLSSALTAPPSASPAPVVEAKPAPVAAPPARPRAPHHVIKAPARPLPKRAVKRAAPCRSLDCL